VTLPPLYFLHGNVTIGYCQTDNNMGVNWNPCSRCDLPFTPTKLFYPISEKDYHLDAFISTQWAALEHAMKNSFMITIFGYGAPKSDVSAIDLMKQGWGNKYERNMEQTEIINVSSEDKLREIWDPFIHTHHYDVFNSFYNSSIACHPRRTGEAWINQYVDAMFLEGNPIPGDLDFPELWQWFTDLRDAETHLAT